GAGGEGEKRFRVGEDRMYGNRLAVRTINVQPSPLEWTFAMSLEIHFKAGALNWQVCPDRSGNWYIM
ncbi:MAG: hypothetical protein ACP5D7_24195, partial [Limnospira sp.]